MSSHMTRYLRLGSAAVLAASAIAAYAQTEAKGAIGTISSIEQVSSIVDSALPPILAGDNSAIAAQMLDPPLAPPLRETFSSQAAMRALFEHDGHKGMPDCSPKGAKHDGSEDDECNVDVGSSHGNGAFRHLVFSKDLSTGNIRFLTRPAFNPNFVAADLKPVTMSDADALSRAVSLLTKGFGLSATEFALPPASLVAVRPNGVVSSLTIRGSSDSGEAVAPTVIQKLVHIRRGLLVKLPSDANGHTQTFVPAPGEAKVVLDTTGVVGVMVEDWRELRLNPAANPKFAKSRQALVSEIAQDLVGDGGARIAHLSAHLVYGTDCRSAGFCYLVPSIRVTVAPATGLLDAGQFRQIVAENIGTAGFVREYALIAPDASLLPAR
jgi:hypothetical protein